MADWTSIARHIAAASGEAFAPRPPHAIGGGCINTTVRLSDGKRSYFVKTNAASRAEMFEAELAGLQALAATRTLRVPEPLCCGTTGTRTYLVMEYIETGSTRNNSPVRAGLQLAALHRNLGPRFGWHRDNTIGATPQPNRETGDWTSFWRDNRLGFQLRLAADNGYRGRLQHGGERLMV